MCRMFEDFRSVTFSELKTHNTDTIIISNSKNLLAFADKNELVVENFNCNEGRTRYVCDYKIDLISWSPDSELIYCCMLKQNLIQVWNVTDPSWKCKISEGFLEINSIRWAPDSRHLLVFCESNFKLTVWSFVSPDFTVIENCKFCKSCISFSNCTRYMATLIRKNSADYVGIYSCDNWMLLKCFPISSENATEIHFSPSDLILAVVSGVSEECQILFYSLDGRLLFSFSRKDSIFGVTSMSWNPRSNYIIFGDYFEEVTVLDTRRYKEISSLNLPLSITSLETNIYKIFKSKHSLTENAETSSCSKYEIISERPYTLSPIPDRKQVKNKVIKSGIHSIQFNADGQYAAILSVSLPNVLFLYSMETLIFSDIIDHCRKITSVSWHSSKPILAFCCADTSWVELWTPNFCVRVVSPYESEFIIKNLEWCSKEDSLILNGKNSSAILSLPQFSI